MVSRFEDRLLAELLEQHGAVLADAPVLPQIPARRARARSWLGLPARRLLPAGALALALATALVALVTGLGSGGGGVTPAYAVVQNGDGTVTVTIRELLGIDGANRELRTLGVRARVVPSEGSCQTDPAQFRQARISEELSRRIVTPVFLAGAPSVVIEPSAIPADDTVVIGVRTLDTQGEPAATGLETAIYEGAAPPCLTASGSG